MAKVSLRAYNREIETLIDRGQYDEAIAHCRHILKTYPKHLESYRLLGKAYLESKRYGDGTDIFSRILAAVSNDFVAHVGMSIIRDEENKLDDAIWHMERAFETQPSNPAIQAELQRLYACRDGVRPPRIRMTRGALANMYVQGELYPQAISEIKSVLKDDPERADMQALLARALFKSGSKNEAADVASSLLRRYPYSLEANRVLAEILGAEHSETAQMYRQRVYELDPYAAQVTGSIFQSAEVSDAAVNVERLDWNGQPVALQPDWTGRAISPETGEQPDWSEPSSFGGIQSAPQPIFGGPTSPEPPPAFGDIESASTPAADQPGAAQEEEIPDFLRAAGWGAATGAFDESKSSFGAEETGSTEAIERGDLPEWIKAMKPVETRAPEPEQEDELPDWIKAIGAGAIASQVFDREEKREEPQTAETAGMEETTQWLGSESTFGATAEDNHSSEFAWLNSANAGESTPADAQEEDLDWLKALGAPESTPSAPQEGPDWLKSLQASDAGSEELDWLKEPDASEAAPFSAQDEPDWLKALGEPGAVQAADQTGESDWLKSLGGEESEPSVPQADSDWLKGLGVPEAIPPDAVQEPSDWLKDLGEPESMPSSASEDQSDWLKGLAIAGGVEAVSHLRPEEEADETKEESAAAVPARVDADFLNQLSEEPVLAPGTGSTPSAVDLGQLGTSEQERDDSFAWLESLAAKQGATEGLLTNPEDRLEEEPEWVRQAKGLKSETSAPQPTSEQPSAALEDLGKSEQDQDDAFAWLESLAAKQGATEGLLTRPEERLDEEPEWVKQARDLNAQEPVAAAGETSQPGMEQPTAAAGPETAAIFEPGYLAEEPAQEDEVEAWLRNLEGEESPAAAPASDETAVWLKGLVEEESVQPLTSQPTDMPDWIRNLPDTPEESPLTAFAEEAELGATWMPPTEEPAPVTESKAEEDALPSWLGELEREEEQRSIPAEADDLPAWLLADEKAPAVAEPTTFSDWKPVEETRPAQPEPEPLAAAPFEMAEAETVLEPEPPKPEPVPVMEAPGKVPEAQPGPASQRESVGLQIPTVDPVLAAARAELAQNNVGGALGSYGKLIKKARYLDEVIYDLREALYRYPVDVGLWQSLGDAYMRANRLQDALDAYTKAEELLR